MTQAQKLAIIFQFKIFPFQLMQYGTDLEYRCPVAWKFLLEYPNGTNYYLDSIRTECQWDGDWSIPPILPECVGKS